MSNEQTDNPGGTCGCIILICSVFLCLLIPPLWFIFIPLGLWGIISIFDNVPSSNNSQSSSESSTSQMQNQANTTSSSSSATVDRHGISWIEDPTSTTLSSSQTSNPIVDHDFLSGSQHFFDIDELLRNLIGQKDLVSREEFKPGETIYLCVRCQLGYHEESYQFLNNRCDQCQTNDKITAYTLPHQLSFDDYYNQGISAFNHKNYEQAINKFTRALTLDPNHTDAYVWRSDAYIQLGQYQQTIEDCTQIISIDPDNIPAYVRLGFARLSLEEYQQSLEDSNRAISLISLTFNQTDTNSWLSQAYAQQGDAHQSLGNSNEAIENYQKSLDIVPTDDLRAKLDALQNQVTQSSQVSTNILTFEEFFGLDQIVENQENTAQVNKILWEDIPKNIQLDAEIDNFSKKQDFNPFEMEFLPQEIPDILLEPNELDIDASYDPFKIEVLTDQAHEDIEILFEEADHEIYTIDLLQELQLAKEKLQATDYEAAIEKFNLVLNHNPDELEAYYHRGIAYAEVGLYSNAIQDFNKTIALNKYNAEAYFQRGMIYKNTGDYKQAIRDFEFTLFFKPNHSLAYQNKRQLMNL